MNRMLAGLFTTIIMALMVWSAVNRSRAPRIPRPDLPDSGMPRSQVSEPSSQDRADLQAAIDCIEGLLASAREGDVSAYLGSFDNDLRARLQREADLAGRAAFAAGLRRASRARGSHSVFAPEPEEGQSPAVRIAVESAFADRIARQTFWLTRAAGRWLVTEIEREREHVPEPALGSRATYHEPEGSPVADNTVDSRGDTID
jgi:hypothetical protein